MALTVDPLAWTVVNAAGERVPAGPDFEVYAGLHQPDALSERLTGTPCLCVKVSR